MYQNTTENVNALNHQQISPPQASRRVVRQAERDNAAHDAKAAPAVKKKVRPPLQRLHCALEAHGLDWALLTLPPGEKGPPCRYTKTENGVSQTAHNKWQQRENALSLEEGRAAAELVPNVGFAVLGDAIYFNDCDWNDPEAVALWRRAITRHAGESFWRGRANSLRCATGHLQDPAAPLYRWELNVYEKTTDGKIGKKVGGFETRGVGNYLVVGGRHPTGVKYEYENGVGVGDWLLSQPAGGHGGQQGYIDAEQDDAIYAELKAGAEAIAEARGYVVIEGSAGGGRKGHGSGRKIDDPRQLGLPEDAPAHIVEATRERCRQDMRKFFEAAGPCSEKHIPVEKGDRNNVAGLYGIVKAVVGNVFWPEWWNWIESHPFTIDEAWNRKIWDSCHHSENGIDRLEAHLREWGCKDISWRAQREFAEPPDPATLPPEYTKQGPLERAVARYVWCAGAEKYFDTETQEFLGSKALNAACVDVAAFGSRGKNTAEAQILNHPDARRVPLVTHKPGASAITEIIKNGRRQAAVNTWQPGAVKPNMDVTTIAGTPYDDLLTKLMGPEGKAEREHLLDRMAFILQRPGEKIGNAAVLVGNQGVGKDSLLRPFLEAVGVDDNVATIDSDIFAGDWGFYLKAQVVYIQEASKRQGGGDFYNKLKPKLSAQKTLLVVNEKNKAQWFIENYQNYIITTNFDDALHLEEGDRRFWAHRVLMDDPLPAEYFERLHEWLGNGGTEAVYGWLLKRDISAFKPLATPPMTAAKQAMLEASQPPAIRWTCEQLREGGLAQRHVVTVREIRRLAGDGLNGPGYELTEKQAIAALKAVGFRSGHRVHFGGGSDVDRLWARGVWGSANAEAMKAQYQKETAKGARAA